ncbi:hypothetical protein F6455_08775 [Proteobacteria bacterium 005FR1]|nr:hypothetical protein [Proteobacteria bacterium 005FR1]
MKVFNFDPAQFSANYSSRGFVHIPDGVAPGFLAFARGFARDAVARDASLADWAIKNKKSQFLFEFSEDTDFVADIKDPVGAVAGVAGSQVTLCERHVKVYNDNAPPEPPPHKDRVASEITVGIPLEVPENSHIILYPQHHREINRFASTALHRASLRDGERPEQLLEGIEPEVARVWPGDVILFKGSSIYHERVNPANTSLLYLKFNTLGLDPLGEDPATQQQRNASLAAIKDIDDQALLSAPLALSSRLEKISRHYSRLFWQEILQANLWGETEVTLTPLEFALIQTLGHERVTSAALLARLGYGGGDLQEPLSKIRELVRNGLMDLVLPD